MLRTLLTTTCIVLLAQCRGQQRGGFSGPVHPLPLRAPVVEYKRHQPPSGLPTPQPLIAIPVSSSLQIGRSFDGFTSQDEEIDFEFLAKQLKSKFQTHLQSQRKFLQNGIQKRFDSLQSFVQTKYDIIALDIEALNNTVTKIENNMDAEPTDEDSPALRMDEVNEVPNPGLINDEESNTLLSIYDLLADFNRQPVSQAPHKWISKLFEFDTFLARNTKVQIPASASNQDSDNDIFATIWITMGAFAGYGEIVMDYLLQFW